MSEYDRTVYLVRWECGIADDWYIVGAYTSKDKAIEEGKVYQERNLDGMVYIETVILPART